jgi:hypothetical protein
MTEPRTHLIRTELQDGRTITTRFIGGLAALPGERTYYETAVIAGGELVDEHTKRSHTRSEALARHAGIVAAQLV